jgi:membrane protein implicated in regulation of membrane protease activity
MDILWWHWLVFGLLLVVAEIASPGGFYIIFFGLSAVVVGLLGAIGVPLSLAVELVLFALLAVGSLMLFRTRLLRWMQADPQAPAVDTLVGEIGTVRTTLSPGAIGTIELRGTHWSARNVSAVTLVSGDRCQVRQVDGLTVHVGPEGARA